jgi:hypothetical protein
VGSVEHVLSAGAIEEDEDKLGQVLTNTPPKSLKRLVGRQAITKTDTSRDAAGSLYVAHSALF